MCYVVVIIILMKFVMKYKEIKINIFLFFLFNFYLILIFIIYFNWEVFGIWFNKYKINFILSLILFFIELIKFGLFFVSRVISGVKYM